MIPQDINQIFKNNLKDYQSNINAFILKICILCSIVGVIFFAFLNVLHVINIPAQNIVKFAVASFINLVTPGIVYWAFKGKRNSFYFVQVFKYTLLVCAAVNYICLLLLIPYREMWSVVFFYIFLSTFFLETPAVSFAICMSILISLTSWIFLPVCRPNNNEELIIRCVAFFFGSVAALTTAFLSRKLLIKSSRNEHKLDQSIKNLKLVFDKSIQQAISSRLDMDIILKLVADEARRLSNAFSAGIFMVEGDDLVLTTFSGDDYQKLLGYRLPIHHSIMGKQLLLGKSCILKSVPEHPEAYLDLVAQARVESMICIPLVHDLKPIGVITVINKLTGEFDLEDENTLNMFAASAVIGIETARMYQEEKRHQQESDQRRRVAEGLRDIVAVLNSDRPIKEILDFIVGQAVKLLGTDTGALYRLQPELQQLRIEAAMGIPESHLTQVLIPVGTGAVGQAVLHKKPVATHEIHEQIHRDFNNKTTYWEHIEWLGQNYCSSLSLPLVCKEEIYGVIIVYFQKQRSFTEEDIELAMTFADQAALAIDNTIIRKQAQENAVAAERSRLARDLHDAVTQTLFSSSLIAEVLPKIWEKNPDAGRKRLEELRQLTRGALAEMRTLLLELRPVTLVEANLDELMRQLCEAITGRARIPVSLKIEEKLSMPVDVKIAFYRIAQEALNNIAKHSGASQAAVVLRKSCDNLEGTQGLKLMISDNGRGFEPFHVTGEHLGISIMRERAQAIGADLSVQSQIGQGTVITIDWVESKEV